MLLATWDAANRVPRTCHTDGQSTELLDLAARAEASDVGSTPLDLLDLRVDELARAYTRAPPAELLRDVRTSARQVGSLLDGRATLSQRRRLLVAAGWLTLLAATLHIDLGQRSAASAARAAAGSLGCETEHDEIGAWACEVDTWTALVDQNWSRATSLAAAGEALAPSGSPAAAQLAMPAARAAARIGDGRRCGQRCVAPRRRWSSSPRTVPRTTISTLIPPSSSFTPGRRCRGSVTRPPKTSPGTPPLATRPAGGPDGSRPRISTSDSCWHGSGDPTKPRTSACAPGGEPPGALERLAGRRASHRRERVPRGARG